jgi:hypothetical protein
MPSFADRSHTQLVISYPSRHANHSIKHLVFEFSLTRPVRIEEFMGHIDNLELQVRWLRRLGAGRLGFRNLESFTIGLSKKYLYHTDDQEFQIRMEALFRELERRIVFRFGAKRLSVLVPIHGGGRYSSEDGLHGNAAVRRLAERASKIFILRGKDEEIENVEIEEDEEAEKRKSRKKDGYSFGGCLRRHRHSVGESGRYVRYMQVL